ncbi:hypothetical protein N656DRAFT_106322 [Canariomyces notabilis]|uniref:Fucose-specific lectin n=1 Tax=Canariomyces notabilis TaxID=2074819 RepID=A0AAN6TCW4_9PEZI|nr:hypothetical protein N656DRAFT_106322 [Canariomyces arenarius]
MNEAQRLATRLSAIGDAVSDQGNRFYLLQVAGDEQDGYDLIEQVKPDSDLISETLVASGVRKQTSAAYLLESDDDRIVFYADEFNNLGAATYKPSDADQGEWLVDEALSSLDFASVHPSGKISACFTKDTLLVFFQKPDGSMGCLEQTRDGWTPLKTVLPATVPVGSPHYRLVVDEKLQLFYIGDGGSLRYLCRDLGEAPGKDTALCGAVSRFAVGYETEKGVLTAYVLAGGVLVSLGENGDRQDLVRATGGGKFAPVASAERCVHIHINGNFVIRGSQNSFNLGGGYIQKGSRRRIRRY